MFTNNSHLKFWKHWKDRFASISKTSTNIILSWTNTDSATNLNMFLFCIFFAVVMNEDMEWIRSKTSLWNGPQYFNYIFRQCNSKLTQILISKFAILILMYGNSISSQYLYTSMLYGNARLYSSQQF